MRASQAVNKGLPIFPFLLAVVAAIFDKFVQVVIFVEVGNFLLVAFHAQS